MRLLLAGAFAAVIVDGTRSIAAGHLDLLPFSDVITRASPDAVARLHGVVQAHAPALWDPVFVTVLLLPSWVVSGVFGLLLLVAGRPRRPTIGHSRR